MGALIATLVVAAYILLWGYVMARGGSREAIFVFSFIGLASIYQALEGGAYWSIFARGHGFFTANRMSALALYLACLYGPVIVARLHWQLVGYKRWRAAILQKSDADK